MFGHFQSIVKILIFNKDMKNIRCRLQEVEIALKNTTPRLGSKQIWKKTGDNNNNNNNKN